MKDLLAIVAVCGALGLLLSCVQAMARIPSMDGEVRRKLVHVGMGMVSLTFPWVFQSAWPVWLLAVLATFVMWQVRVHPRWRAHFGKAVHDVPRHSWGEICFPWAVAAVFWLANGDPVRFGIPLLLLTFADAAGALAGRRYGRANYDTPGGSRKTVEGSLAVFGVGFLCAHLPLLLMTGMGRAESVVVSLTLALLVTVAESVSVRGLDNLIIPLGSFFLLSAYEQMTLEVLIGRLLIIIFLLGVALVTRRWTSLDVGAALGAVLLGYGGWALGGAAFFVCLLGYYFRHIVVLLARPHWKMFRLGIVAVLSVTASTLPWLGWERLQYGHFLWPFTLAVCAHSAVNYHGGLLQGRSGFCFLLALQAVGVTFLVCLVPVGFVVGWRANWLVVLGVEAPLLLGLLWLCSRILPRAEDGSYAIVDRRFFYQALAAFVVSLPALLIPPP